jgi:hypothetical protein
MNQWHGFQALFNQDKPDKPTWENQSLAMGTQAAASKLEQCTRWTSSTLTFYICFAADIYIIIYYYYIYNYIYIFNYLFIYLFASVFAHWLGFEFGFVCMWEKESPSCAPTVGTVIEWLSKEVQLKVGDGRCMVVPAGSVGAWPPGGLAPPSIQLDPLHGLASTMVPD